MISMNSKISKIFISLTLVFMFVPAVFAQVASIHSDQISVERQRCQGNRGYKVHLSFDDGPRIPQTEQILDILKRRGVKATFLVSMSHFKNMAKGNPPNARERRLLRVIERMKQEGHTVGSHSFEHWDHTNTREHSEEQILANLEKSYRVVNQLGLEKPVPFRFPYGSGWLPSSSTMGRSMSASLMRKIKENGYRPFHWDLDTEDWSAVKRKALPDSLLRQVCQSGGGVALMHDIHSWTVNNLDAMIQSLQRSGHEIVPYKEIIRYNKRSLRDDFNGTAGTQGVRSVPNSRGREAPPANDDLRDRDSTEWSGGLY